MKNFAIDFIRQTIEQTLLEEHLRNPMLFGGKDQVALTSFYEQLQNQEQVDRFVEVYRDLADQQNRTGLILNGVLVSSENPTITNIRNSLIIPMTWTCSFRCTLENRDTALETIHNMISILKGRKVDIAEALDTGELFKVGTFGNVNNGVSNGKLTTNQWCYLGEISSQDTNAWVLSVLANHPLGGFYINETKTFYASNYDDDTLSTIIYDTTTQKYIEIEDDGSYPDVIFAPKKQFEEYKLTMSFDAIRCDTPSTLNGQEYIEISFGGSATLVSREIKLGNDLVGLTIQKKKIVAKTPITFNNAPVYQLDPLEMPSGNAANTQVNQLISNQFKVNTHTDSNNITLQYSFVVDNETDILKQLYNYGRYGTQGVDVNSISPNMIFEVCEYYCDWAMVEKHTIKTKLVEGIDIENTESDVMNMTITLQIQGDND